MKNGKTRHGQQNIYCGRQFVENPKWRKISEETKQLIDRLLLEKIPLAGISFLNLGYKTINQKYSTPRH